MNADRGCLISGANVRGEDTLEKKLIQNKSEEKTYIHYLASASEALLKYIESEQFINWAIGSLFEHLKPAHVSVALYDAQCDSFLIKHSIGTKQFPAKFVRLQRTSAIVEWFAGQSRSEKVTTILSEKPLPRKIPGRILTDLKRHLSSACAHIRSRNNLGGYLLVGDSQSLPAYSEYDQAYFQTVANDIAVEMEKQHYYQTANTDALTKLLNRQSLPEKITQRIQEAVEKGQMFALCMVDLDNFKKINDRHGHLAGDEVLRQAAQALRKGIRQTDLAFRYGGEEFLVIFGANPRQGLMPYEPERFQRFAVKAAERLRLKLARQRIQYSQHHLQITGSIGMTFFDPANPQSLEQLIEVADQAVYFSKNSGKNKVTLYAGSKDAVSFTA